MNTEEKKAKLEFMQRFFVKSFLVSFILLLLASVMCVFMHDYQVAIVNKFFPLDDIKDLNFLILLVFGIWKVLIIQFTLVPALVVWCMRHCCKCGCEK